MDSVGKNLFGTAVFGTFFPVDPIFPSDPMRLDIGDNSILPITVNVFNKPTSTAERGAARAPGLGSAPFRLSSRSSTTTVTPDDKTIQKRVDLLTELGSDAVLDSAYLWLCKQRRRYPISADIWDLRYHWPREKAALQAELRAGCYRFAPLRRVRRPDGEEVDLWSSRDALVLKALSRVLAGVLPVSRGCFHVKGRGGARAALRQVMRDLPANRFVLHTDVQCYYASVDHFLLLEQLAVYVEDRAVLNLLWQYMHRTSERGGLFWEVGKGISLGCPLSPLMGAFFLRELDERLEGLGLCYVRYMDDIVVLSPTRWKLRQAVRVLNQTFAALGLEKHPGKTTLGRIDRGFDFLGFRLRPEGITVAPETLARFMARAARLYEREPGAVGDRSRLGGYVKRWRAWARAGGSCAQPSPVGSGAGHCEVAGTMLVSETGSISVLKPSGAAS